MKCFSVRIPAMAIVVPVLVSLALAPASAQSLDPRSAPRTGPAPAASDLDVPEGGGDDGGGGAGLSFFIDELPFRIEACGSYQVTRCLRGAVGEHGITIAADDVTLDLRGNAIVGIPGALSGVRVLGALSGITVKNGVLRRWGGDGVDASLASESSFRDLHLLDNGGAGLLAGTDALVAGCMADGNGGVGLAAESGLISDSTSTNGGAAGISLGVGTVRACTVARNDTDGIVSSGSCTVVQCNVSESGEDGIDVGPGSTVLDSSVSVSTENGIVAGEGTTVNRCTVTTSTSDGIVAADGASIVSCSVRDNVMNGIRVASRCSVRDNSCTNNGTIGNNGAGILVPIFETSSRIESNILTGNGKGIEVIGSLNLIVRNSASLNGDFDFDIANGNSFGTVVFVPGAFGGDPWANFQY